MFIIVSNIIIGQNFAVNQPTSPIGENSIYNTITAVKRVTETGNAFFHGVRSITFYLLNTHGVESGLICPMMTIIRISEMNRIA